MVRVWRRDELHYHLRLDVDCLCWSAGHQHVRPCHETARMAGSRLQNPGSESKAREERKEYRQGCQKAAKELPTQAEVIFGQRGIRAISGNDSPSQTSPTPRRRKRSPASTPSPGRASGKAPTFFYRDLKV